MCLALYFLFSILARVESLCVFFFLMIRRPPRSTLDRSSAASDVYKRQVPATAEGIKRYLGSGMVRGVGKVMAERIVNRFGAETLDVIDDQPERLREVCLLYTSPSPRDRTRSRMPSSA